MIRSLEEKDIDELVELEKVLFPNSPWPKEEFLYELNENPFSNFLIYEEENQILGYVDLWLIYEQAQIADLGVRKEAQRKGIAKQLMDECVKRAVKAGCENISLEVRVSNTPAIKLYESFGFINAATRKGYYENGEDGILMVKPIGGLSYDDDISD